MNRLSFILFLFLGVLLMALFATACSEAQQNSVALAVAELSHDIDDSLQSAEYLEFAGKVTDPATGRWTNDYMVIFFLNGEEIARSVSHLGECEFSGEGVHDGLFHIHADNLYKLTVEDNPILAESGQPLQVEYGLGQLGDIDDLHFWFGELTPGTIKVFDVPSKQIKYTLVVLDTLDAPERLGIRVAGTAILTSENKVAAKPLLPGEYSTIHTGGQDSFQPVDSLPPVNTQTAWNRQITGVTGNRWSVWSEYVAYQVPGMSWDAFLAEVTLHNPQLVRDNYIFYPGQTYLLPDLPATMATQ